MQPSRNLPRGIRRGEHSRHRGPAGLQHPLITYHYRSKDICGARRRNMRFAQIREGWDTFGAGKLGFAAARQVAEEYTTLFRYTVAFPEFHRFMRQEAMSGSPRLKWVAETVLAPLLERLIPQIVLPKSRGCCRWLIHPVPLHDGQSHHDARRFRA